MPIADIYCSFRQRLPRLARLFAAALCLFWVILFCGLRVYSVRLSHRTATLLDEASRIQIGAPESSVLPLVSRFHAVRYPIYDHSYVCADSSTSNGSSITMQSCPSQADIEYQKVHQNDYAYRMQISPFDLFNRERPLRGARLYLGYFISRTPILLRNLISMRDSLTIVSVRINDGRVMQVHAQISVEGSSDWIGHGWTLTEAPLDPDHPALSYRAQGDTLLLITRVWRTMHEITPAATPEQIQAARSINMHCLSNVLPCHSVRSLSPFSYAYQIKHPNENVGLMDYLTR